MAMDGTDIVVAIRPDQARLNITWAKEQGDLPEPVPWDATDAEIIGMATEAIQTGHVPGITADADVNFDGFRVDRFDANEGNPINRLSLRPKTEFGS